MEGRVSLGVCRVGEGMGRKGRGGRGRGGILGHVCAVVRVWELEVVSGGEEEEDWYV